MKRHEKELRPGELNDVERSREANKMINNDSGVLTITQFHPYGRPAPVGERERINELEAQIERANKRVDVLVAQMARIMAERAGE